MGYENKQYGDNGHSNGHGNGNDRNNDSIYSKRVKAGKRRTYFFDVRSTRGNDYFLTITESKKRFDENSYERHKIFLYKEDFNKFADAMIETIEYVKTELMPDFDFDAFSHDDDDNYQQNESNGNRQPLSYNNNNDNNNNSENTAPNYTESPAPAAVDSSDDEGWKS